MQIWKTKHLKLFRNILLILYFGVSFVFPLIFIYKSFSNLDIAHVVKASLLMLITLVCVLLALTRALKERIQKINIENMDGTFNTPLQLFKNICWGISKGILPAAFILITIILKNSITNFLEFYPRIIIIVLAANLVGIIFETITLFIDDELKVRADIAHDRAKALRNGVQ